MSGLLLDTNVVIWLLLGDRDAVAPAAIKALEDETNEIFASSASVWEIAIKRSLGKLEIEPRWYETFTTLDFEPLLINMDHARRVEQLPWHHRDPFDRVLIAQAMVEGHGVVSSDGVFQKYGVDVVW